MVTTPIAIRLSASTTQRVRYYGREHLTVVVRGTTAAGASPRMALMAYYIAGDFGHVSGARDVFLRKYDTNGSLQWTRPAQGNSRFDSLVEALRQTGWAMSSSQAQLTGVSTGPTRASVLPFLSKYDADGVLQWSRQFGSAEGDAASSVAVDGMGSVYISGYTYGSLDGATFGESGRIPSRVRVRRHACLVSPIRYGVAWEWAQFVSSDEFGVMVCGFTDGNLEGTNAGNRDVFLTRFDTDGNRLWTRQFGTSGRDEALGVTSHLGSVYFAGVWDLSNTKRA